jgi:biopolymer transport protein ExbD
MKLPSPVQKKHVRIEIIPLIDIMFFLLASFMMVSLQLDQTQNIKVELPASTEGVHDFKPDMLNIAVDKSGAVWLEKKKITLPELSAAVSNHLRLNTNLPVYISGDRDTLEGAMQEVMERVRNAGVQKFAFTVGDNSNPDQKPPAAATP